MNNEPMNKENIESTEELIAKIEKLEIKLSAHLKKMEITENQIKQYFDKMKTEMPASEYAIRDI